jgi:hypothetical protein
MKKKHINIENIRTAPIPFGKAIGLLRDLADLQNGPPLEQFRKERETTMKNIYPFLKKWERVKYAPSPQVEDTEVER